MIFVLIFFFQRSQSETDLDAVADAFVDEQRRSAQSKKAKPTFPFFKARISSAPENYVLVASQQTNISNLPAQRSSDNVSIDDNSLTDDDEYPVDSEPIVVISCDFIIYFLQKSNSSYMFRDQCQVENGPIVFTKQIQQWKNPNELASRSSNEFYSERVKPPLRNPRKSANRHVKKKRRKQRSSVNGNEFQEHDVRKSSSSISKQHERRFTRPLEKSTSLVHVSANEVVPCPETGIFGPPPKTSVRRVLNDDYYDDSEIIQYEVDVNTENDDHNKVIRWQRGGVIGNGAFGSVFIGINTETGELLAIKTIPFVQNQKNKIEVFFSQIRYFSITFVS